MVERERETHESPRESRAPESRVSEQIYSRDEASSWKALNSQKSGGAESAKPGADGTKSGATDSGQLNFDNSIYTAADLSRAGRPGGAADRAERQGSSPERQGAPPDRPNAAPDRQGERPGATPERPGSTAERPGSIPERPSSPEQRPEGATDTPRANDASDAPPGRPRVPSEAREYNAKMSPYTVKPGDSMESIAKDRLPAGSDWQRQSYVVGLQHANALKPGQELEPGKELKTPDVQRDGSVLSQNGSSTLLINKDQSFSMFNSATGKGVGRDSAQKPYESERMPDGSIKRSYPDLSERTINADGTGGTGRDSSLRQYKYTTDQVTGSEDRKYADTGAEMRVNPDGSSIYKGAKAESPTKPVLELRDTNNQPIYRQPLNAEENKRSLSDAIRHEAVSHIGNGALVSGKGRYEGYVAGSELLKAATSDAYGRAGGGEKGMDAVGKLHSDIQSKLRTASGDSNAQFSFERDMHNGHEIYSSKQVLKLPNGGVRRSHHPFDLDR